LIYVSLDIAEKLKRKHSNHVIFLLHISKKDSGKAVNRKLIKLNKITIKPKYYIPYQTYQHEKNNLDL